MNSLTSSFKLRTRSVLVLLAAAITLIAALLVIFQTAAAQEGATAAPEAAPTNPIHPPFALLDSDGQNVLNSGNAVSTMKTCGECHDTDFITTHSFHTDVGLSTFGSDTASKTHTWDQSTGQFGQWDPLTYRYLSSQGDSRVDMTTAEWIKANGARHAGGGPAEISREGQPLTSLAPDAANVEASIIDSTGAAAAWNWQQSGTVEMNCFLCHTANPNNDARIKALKLGQFRWASTATLLNTGLVTQIGNSFAWSPDGFDADGNVREGIISLQDPTNENCGLCHGVVHTNAQDPLTVAATCDVSQWNTATTGQIISPQKMQNSGMNLENKNNLARTWDVHAERVVKCTACHSSLNNPVYFQQPDQARPEYLTFDPRRIDFSDYLKQPLHQFAKGDVYGGAHVEGVDNTLRSCESCHNIAATHNWLPYKDTHMSVLDCETCHVPEMVAPAIDYVDWTVLKSDGKPVSACRGVNDSGLITGFTPVLLPRQNASGATSLAPNNLVTAWYWIYGSPARPVPQRDLTAAWLENGQYPAEILAAFDANADGALSDAELVIDNDAKQQIIADRLTARGLDQVRIAGEVQPYSISHDIAAGDYAIRDCSTCHTEKSRIGASVELARRQPGGVIPTLNEGIANAHIISTPDGLTLEFDHTAPTETSTGIYVFGHDSVYWIDWLGIALFLGTLVGVVVHGGLRFMSARRDAAHAAQTTTDTVYMYAVYERLWHWLQTATILLLIFTGLIIHKPDKFGIFAFDYVVQVHNILAALLVINAALSLFYHLVSGEIRQYLPRPYGFFDDTIVQAKYYLSGIFKREPHPFEKTPQRKLNPLQQITYFGILNVLLPLQILTGLLMWGVQIWPDVATRLGGLPWLAPFHTIIAWAFAAFVVLHVYLTTTGPTPLAGMQAMIMGWDEVEIHHHSGKEGEQ